MERHQADSPTPLVRVIPGHKPPEAVRDLAYDLWAWKHGQNAAAVARELGVEERTVQRWARDDDWRVRYQEERVDQSPQMARYTTALILGSAAPKAAAKLEAMLDGTVPYDKTMAGVCQIVLDRTGFAPVNLRDTDPAARPPVKALAPPVHDYTAAEVAAMSDADLLAFFREDKPTGRDELSRLSLRQLMLLQEKG
jgi:hypothetical protein